MDLLTDLIQNAGLEARVFARHAFVGPWGLRFPCHRSAGFHVVLQGECFLRGPGFATPLRLERGDVVFTSRGVYHELSSSVDGPAEPVAALASTPPLSPGTPVTTLVGAAYQFREEPSHPFFDELPALFHWPTARLAAHHPIHAAVSLLSSELSDQRPGSEAVVARLVDVLFHYIVRAWIDQRSGGWAEALRDEPLAKALGAMHRDPARAWDVPLLAAQAGLSRAAFAGRFKRVTGETPAHYLSSLRMQAGMARLRESEAGLEAIAAAVGYANAFAFSKAFKRHLGMSPGAYRRGQGEAARAGSI